MTEQELKQVIGEQLKSFKEELPVGISKTDLDKALAEKSKEIEKPKKLLREITEHDGQTDKTKMAGTI